jgi:hypothetical protein
MQGFNKFRVLTVGFILMFVFAIAAMYTNTKDIAMQKSKNSEIAKNNISNDTLSNDNLRFHKKDTDEDYLDQIDVLTARVDNLEKSLRENNNDSGLNCQIRGVLDNGDVIPLSPSESVEEANLNKKELVITCTVK